MQRGGKASPWGLQWIALGAALGAVALYAGLDLYAARRDLRNLEESRLRRQASVVQQSLGQKLQATASALEALRADVPRLLAREDGVDKLNEQLRVMAASMTGVRSFLVVNAEGRSIASNRPELIGNDFSQGERYRTIRDRPDPQLLYVSPPFTTPLGAWAIALGRVRLDAQGRFDGYVLAVVDPEYFNLLLDSTRYAPDSSAALIHGDGKVIYRMPDPGGAVGMNLAEHPDSLYARHLRSGVDESTWTATLRTSGKHALAVLQTIRPTSTPADDILVASIARETEAMYAPWHREVAQRGVLLGVVALVASGSLFVHQRRRQAMARLQAAQEEERRGKEEALRQAEDLRRSEALFRTMAESAPVGVFQTDAAAAVVYVNRAAAIMMGRSPESGLGEALREAVHPDDRERVLREWNEAFSARTRFATELRFVKPDGEVATIQIYADAIPGAPGQVTGYVGVLVDVTRQRATERQLALTSRLSALGTLSAGVAHEINNPLAVIVGDQAHALGVAGDVRARLAGEGAIDRAAEAAQLDEVMRTLEDAQRSGKRIARIVNDLATFASPRPQRERLSLRSVVLEAKRWIPAETWETITLLVQDEGAPDVLAAPGLLQQLVLNLVDNAAKATPRGERDTVLVRIAPGSPGRVLLEVVDNGAGIPAEMQERIFEPFFTTRGVGEGHGPGLGLSVSRSIATSLGGTLTVESGVGQGATFRLELPAAPAEG